MQPKNREKMPDVREPKPTWSSVSPDARRAISAVLGVEITGGEVVFGGFSSSATFTLTLADGSRAFVKGGHGEQSTFINDAVRREALVYRELPQIAAFSPKIFGTAETADWFFLVMEDLSDAAKAPPWTPATWSAAIARLAEFHNMRIAPPSWTDDVAKVMAEDAWKKVATDASCKADLCALFANSVDAARWFDEALPKLIVADAEFPPRHAGSSILHLDMRSDNILFKKFGGEAVFLDWNWLHTGSGVIDMVYFATSIFEEGGPHPDLSMQRYQAAAKASFSDRDVAVCAANVAGYFALRAHLSPVADAPRLRWAQRLKLFASLDWASRLLGLPPPPPSRV